MKKIHTLTLAGMLSAFSMQAQLVLTQAANEPVAGDLQSLWEYDSVHVVPKNTGQHQVWNFSGIIQTTNAVQSQTYSAASTVTSSSFFPGATLAVCDDPDYCSFFKTSGTPPQYEYMGNYQQGTVTNFTNTMIAFTWPISYGYLQTGSHAGPASNGTSSRNIFGLDTIRANGEGTLILPGGLQYSPVLQITRATSETLTPAASSTVTTFLKYTQFEYYHASQKFPVLTVSYFSGVDTHTYTAAYVYVNKTIHPTGLEDQSFAEGYNVFPNPASDHFSIKLSNNNSEKCSVQISNLMGSVVQNIDLGNKPVIAQTIDISGLSAGVYFVRTQLGDKASTRKLVVE